MSLTLSPQDRAEWTAQYRTALRLRKQYPTLLITLELVIRVAEYLAVLESSNDALRALLDERRSGERRASPELVSSPVGDRSVAS